MTFWIITVAMALATAGILALALRRGDMAAEPAAEYDLRVYRDQLAEVDRDLARGVLDPRDAERVRTEISRRILAADAALGPSTGTTTGGSAGVVWMAAMGLVLVAGSGLLYFQLGAPGYGDMGLQDRIAAAEVQRESRPGQAAYVETLLRDLKATAERVDDEAERADLLARIDEVTEERERQIADMTSQIEAAGADATGADYVRLAGTMIMAAGGYVSPEAEAALEQALALDPGNGPARYYWGLMLAQIERPDQAFRIWDALLRQGPADAPWISPIRAQIEELAWRAGVNYVMPEPGTGTAGPSASDIEAAGEMSSAERMEMIEGMVGGLSQRLASEGGTVAEWAQLITALGVLGRTGEARSVYEEARERFDDQPGALDTIGRAGERAGVSN